VWISADIYVMACCCCGNGRVFVSCCRYSMACVCPEFYASNMSWSYRDESSCLWSLTICLAHRRCMSIARRQVAKVSTLSGNVFRSLACECSNCALNISRLNWSYWLSSKGRARKGIASYCRFLSLIMYSGLAGRLKSVVSYIPPFVSRS
jgi:hypothetical protein